ncbi:MAG: cyclic nucleotide-binding domain-containing protein [Verrucomicrobiae bacterium]|nr:cyclic nucleotide-binding domain-containing protein [Verrucomicrobiae bacterium]
MGKSSCKKTVRIPHPLHQHLQAQMAKRETDDDSFLEPSDSDLPVEILYHVFGVDHQCHGPVHLDELKSWAQQKLLTPKTWVFLQGPNVWRRTGQIKQIREFLEQTQGTPEKKTAPSSGQLQRLGLFKLMGEDAASSMLPYLRRVEIHASESIAKLGACATSMHIILEGEATIFIEVDDQPRRLRTLLPGDFFGEQALIEEKPYLYNVQATAFCILLRLRHADFQEIMETEPDLACQFLLAVLQETSHESFSAREHLSNAKTLVRGGVGRTGKVFVPVVRLQKTRTARMQLGGPGRALSRGKFGDDYDGTFIRKR